jgi:hypothetical protein
VLKVLQAAARRDGGRWLVALAATVLCCLAVASTAVAAVPSVDIGASPLLNVSIGSDLSCQIKHTGDSALEFFPSSATPGDCGTFVAAGGTVFGPNFSQHDGTATSGVTGGSYSAFSGTTQSGKTGSGTSAKPFKVVTSGTAGSLAVTETDSYVSGQESYRTDVTVTNNGGGAANVTIYRAGDCFLQNSDSGFGMTGDNGAVGCAENANNTPPGRIIEWVPITSGANFLEDGYNEVWEAIAKQTAFPNQCVHCADKVDNGAGISWTASIAPGQSQTFSQFTTLSPTGKAGPPPPTPTVTKPTLKVTGVPSTCTTRNFTARYTATKATRTTVTLDGKRVASTKRSKFSVLVAVTSLRRGRHVLRAVATGAGGKATKVRAFSRCAARRVVRPRFTG